MLTLLRVGFSLFVYFQVRKIKGYEEKEQKIDETLCFGYVMFAIALVNFFVNNASRMLWYFELPFYVSLVNMSLPISLREKAKNILPLVAFCGIAMFVSMILRPYYFSLFPYQFWH